MVDDVDYDDSFSEERFMSGTSANSWESYSFDSEERSRSSRPSSRTSLRDRRKQFDTTTPTLIDEEDMNEEEEMASLEQARLQGLELKDDSSMRRTPGAAMYKSAYDSDANAEASSLRRTPGASAMQQSAFQQPSVDSGQEKEARLGYAFNLSSTVAGEDMHRVETGGQGIRESYSHRSTTPSPVLDRGSTEPAGEHQKKNSSAPSDLSVTQGTGGASVAQSEHSSFSFQPWAKSKNPMQSNVFSPDSNRQGAFSPRLLRLEENIGNLLQEDEDEDDAYAAEIPEVFRFDESAVSGGGIDWTTAFDVESNSRFARKLVQRGSAPKDGKTRRNRPNPTSQGTFLPHAQQPKPRRSVNEVFEFGRQQRNDDTASPQLPNFNFGGAFAPPAKDSMGSFTRPVANAASQAPPPVFGSRPYPSQPPSFQAVNPGAGPRQTYRETQMGQPVSHAHSFDSYRSGNARTSPVEAYFQPHRFASPSPPAMMHAPPTFGTQQSDMHATAQEFVPMATRSNSNTPLFSAQPWPTQQPMQAQAHFDAPLDQASWHSTSGYQMGTSFGGYGMHSPSFTDSRAGMTPSPHIQHMWSQGEQSLSGGTGQGREEGVTGASSAPPQTGLIGSDPFHRGKKDTKRGKRGKKKGQQRAEVSTSTKKAPLQVKGKKKTSDSRPPSTTLSTDGNVDDCVSASDDTRAVDTRRAELDETPATRAAFKEFYKAYRAEEQVGVQNAEHFATQALAEGKLPESIHWRVYIELADLARRSNRFAEARRQYQKVCDLQPYASQGWVEHSKLEEECGNMNRVTNILHEGLKYCEFNENILIRAIKHHERLGNLQQARILLARLQGVSVEKVWRTILEGAMLEARAGNFVIARRVLKYIMHHVPWYGPLYVEFYRLERDHGCLLDALNIVERGLSEIPRYGPLWFSALRVCEELDFQEKHFHLPKTTEMLERASINVSKEIAWKVHLEASFICERAAQLQEHLKMGDFDTFLAPARYYFSLTIRACRLNLRWKVWLAAARMELAAGNTSVAQKLFFRAHEVAPEKVRSLTFLDFARMHEYVGHEDLARAILCKGRFEYGHDWKVWLESVLLEMRCFKLIRAYDLAARAIEVHPGTGRLWAALVQLSQHIDSQDDAQYTALRDALNAVPKSGEVWCEGARIHLNPFSDRFDIGIARRHLYFAGKFTPQYGDSFLEAVRLELLSQWFLPISDFIWEQTKSSFSSSKASQGLDCLTKYITDVSLAISVARLSESEVKKISRKFPFKQIVSSLRRRLHSGDFPKGVDLSRTILECSNADPNYGPLWFSCRPVQTDPPRRVVERAASTMVEELRQHAHVYLAAMVRRKAVLSTIMKAKPPTADDSLEIYDKSVKEWEDRVSAVLRASPSLREIFNPLDPTTGSVLLESTINGSDFVTGLMEYNRHRPIERMSLLERKRAIFATDALFP